MLTDDKVLIHPDYLDYVEKRKIKHRAIWFDVKNLLRKVADVQRTDCRVVYVHDGHWQGWLVEFTCDVDVEEIKRNIWGVLQLGERVIFVGINNG